MSGMKSFDFAILRMNSGIEFHKNGVAIEYF